MFLLDYNSIIFQLLQFSTTFSRYVTLKIIFSHNITCLRFSRNGQSIICTHSTNVGLILFIRIIIFILSGWHGRVVKAAMLNRCMVAVSIPASGFLKRRSHHHPFTHSLLFQKHEFHSRKYHPYPHHTNHSKRPQLLKLEK